MTIRQLEIFSAIVEKGRFTAAAEALRLAQPSVSLQIQLLEDELGEKLFLRTKNSRLQITEAGRILKEHSDRILLQCKLAKMEIASVTQQPVGNMRIGVGGHQLTSMLPPALSAFHARFPKVSVSIVNGTSPQLIEMLRAEQLDLGIITFPVHAKELRAEELFSEELVFVVNAANPVALQGTVTRKDIEGLPLVLYDRTTSTRARIDEYFRESGLQPNVILELSSVEAMKRMVEAGLGATIIPRSALLDFHGELHALQISGRPLTRRVGVAMPHILSLPAVVKSMKLLIKIRFEEITRRLNGT